MKVRRIALLAATLALLVCGGVARATTGALELVHPPHVTVPYTRAAQFQGRYRLEGVGSGAGIRSAQMKIEFSLGVVPEYLIGAAQFYEYNPDGQLEIGLFTLFPFREVPPGVSVTVLKKGLGTGGQKSPVGTMVLDKPTDDQVMTGEIELHGKGPFPVVFRRLSENAQAVANPPAAKQLDNKVADPGPLAPATSTAGWADDLSEYEGSYKLIDPAPDPTAGAGTLGPVIAVTQNIGASISDVTGGRMKISGVEIPTGEIIVETGSLKQTFYLSNFVSEGETKLAQVHEASAHGPVIGSFEGTLSGQALKGTLEAHGSQYHLTLRRTGP